MKITKLLFSLLALLLICLCIVPASVLAENTNAPVKNEPVLTGGFDAYANAGSQAGGYWSHGNNQNRIVTVSDASYMGSLTGETEDGEGYTVIMVQIKPDGTCRNIVEGEIVGLSSTTITIMADKNENIWMYSGWDIGSGFFETRLWFYDTKADTVTTYENRLTYSKGGGGYSVAIMDPTFHRIYAIACNGDAPSAYFSWAIFDIETVTWEKKLYSYKTGERYCYHYGYADGHGGFFVVDERDITNGSADTNIPGLRVREAMATLHSRKSDAGYMWDIPKLLIVPDAKDKNCVEVRTVEPYNYDVENGLYPNVYNGCNDVLVVGDYLYVQLCLDDAGKPGRRTSLHVLDMKDNFKEIAYADINFLYGINTEYCSRLFHDTDGHLYILAVRSHSYKMEIWEAVNDLQTEFHLVTEKDLGLEACSIIMSSSRNNSYQCSKASMLVGTPYSYHFFEVDFGA